jgi:hypothetical protein
VQQVFFAPVNEATARVLAAEGCEVIAPRRQGCCGALALHAGRDEDARAFARALIQSFNGRDLEQIVVNAAGCGSTMKMYGELLKDDPQWAERARRFAASVRDATETLAALGAPQAARHPLELRLAYHDACHLAHAQGSGRAARRPVADPGLTPVPLAENEISCGSAGISIRAASDGRGTGPPARHRRIAPRPSPHRIPAASCKPRGRPRERPRDPRLHVMELVDASIRELVCRERRSTSARFKSDFEGARCSRAGRPPERCPSRKRCTASRSLTHRWLEGDNSNPDQQGRCPRSRRLTDSQNRHTRSVLDNARPRGPNSTCGRCWKSARHRADASQTLLFTRREGNRTSPFIGAWGTTERTESVIQRRSVRLTTVEWYPPSENGRLLAYGLSAPATDHRVHLLGGDSGRLRS